MTVAASTRLNGPYSGNDVTVAFAYTWRIEANTELRVILRDEDGEDVTQTLTTHYTVSGVSVDGGGNVTFVTAPATGEVVIIEGVKPKTQTVEYTATERFPYDSHQAGMDKLLRIDQEQQRDLDRALKFPHGETVYRLPLKPADVTKLLAQTIDGEIVHVTTDAPAGADGDSAYTVAVNNGYVGTEPEWLETLIGTSSRDEQVFSGDAVDTTFVFTGMVITDKLNIMIFVDGIVQRESDYGLSNDGTDTTITFTSAPPLGTDNIVMRGAVLTGGGAGGTGDVVGPASATDGNLAAFDTTTGKLIKQLTFTQVTAALNAVVGDSGSGGTKGLVPAPAAGDAAANKFLKANGTWAAPSGSGDVVGPASVTDSNLAAFDTTTGKLIKQVTNANAFAQIKQAASDTATGVVELATDAETETGTDTARAVTPANVTASYIKKSLVTTRGDIITRGASAPQRLALGASGRVLKSDGTDAVWAGQSEIIIIAVGDETTAITTGTAKVTFRMPFAMTLTSVRGSLTTVSSSGIPTVNIKETGTTIFSTKLTIDASEKTSTTAATPAVLSDTALADDAEITIDIDVAGTGAAGLKVALIGTRA
jgi:hypothetical protein